MRSVRSRIEQNTLNSAEFAYYWSQNIILNYTITETMVEDSYGNPKNKNLKVSIFVTSTDEIIRKFNDDRQISIRYIAEMKKKRKHAPISFYHSTYERVSKFVKDIYSTDRTIENFDKLISAFKRERYLQKYFYDSSTTFMSCKKGNDHLTRMNKFNWESEDYSYTQKIEEIPESRLERAPELEKYLYHAKNFKQRYRKLLSKISKKLEVCNWHSYLKVGRFDVLARSINPIINFPEHNKEVILRRHVFKALYKYSSLALNRNLLVKEIPSEENTGKLMFLSPSWITPNFCVIYLGFYNVEALERQQIVEGIEDLLLNDDMINKNLVYIPFKNRVTSLLVSLPIDIINKQEKATVNNKEDSRAIAGVRNENQSDEPKEEKTESIIPSYIFQSQHMNIFNFIPYKSIRLANNYCKKWIWVKDNKKIIADFIKIIARHRICEGFELVHTCNDDLLFIKDVKLHKQGGFKGESDRCLIQYLIRQDKNDPTYVKTEVYLEKESGYYMIKQKKDENESKQKLLKISCDECECHESLYESEETKTNTKTPC